MPSSRSAPKVNVGRIGQKASQSLSAPSLEKEGAGGHSGGLPLPGCARAVPPVKTTGVFSHHRDRDGQAHLVWGGAEHQSVPLCDPACQDQAVKCLRNEGCDSTGRWFQRKVYYFSPLVLYFHTLACMDLNHLSKNSK